MEWTEAIGKAVQYMENHITEKLTAEEIAGQVYLSPFYFQKGFTMLCGFTVAEYIRNRRLALAGAELAAGHARVIDVALKYGYDTPDSFAKAFTRFHGITPVAARQGNCMLRSFAPLKIKLSLEGGYLMDYRMEEKKAFTVIASAGEFRYEDAKKEIPLFWQKHFAEGKGQTVMGMYGINIDEEMGHDSFTYLIADPYREGEKVPDGFSLYTIPAFTWAFFPCVGPLPAALQDVNTRIFAEWLPALKDYVFAAGYCVEMYDSPARYPKGTGDEKYYCEIWIPVKRK